MTGVLLIERSGGHVGSGAGAFIFGVPALGGLYGAARKFWVLTQPKTDTVPERPRPIASVVESVKRGAKTQGLSFSLGGAALMASNSVSLDNGAMLFAGSAFLGLIDAARTFGSLSQPAPTPTLPATGPKVDKNLAPPPIEPKKVQIPLSTAEKITGSLFVGILGGTLTFACTMPFLLLAGGGHNMSVHHQNRLMLDALKLSLLVGLVSYQSAYASLSNGTKVEGKPGQPGVEKAAPKVPPGPTLAERWNRMSKTKRRRIIVLTTLALAAAGVAYVGPSTIADKFSEAMKTLADLHEKYAFETKTKRETKPIGEWLKVSSFTDKEEMERLAALPLASYACPDKDPPPGCQDVVATTCAEILNTCHLPEDDLKGHKKVQRQLSLKFSQDKHKGSKEEEELAKKAQMALNHAKEIYEEETCYIRKNGTKDKKICDMLHLEKCGEWKDTCKDLKEKKDLAGAKEKCVSKVVDTENVKICVTDTGACDGGGICNPISATWTARVPNWLYKKLGVEIDCQIQDDEGNIDKEPSASCAHMI